MSEKITVIDRQHRETANVVAIMVACERRLTTKPEFMVAKDEILAALVTGAFEPFNNVSN